MALLALCFVFAFTVLANGMTCESCVDEFESCRTKARESAYIFLDRVRKHHTSAKIVLSQVSCRLRSELVHCFLNCLGLGLLFENDSFP